MFAVDRAWLHDMVPELCNSKTISPITLPGAKLTYIEPSPVMKIEYKGQVSYMPITNIKLMCIK